MNELEIFTFNSNEVKTTLINNEPYFNLKDICDILEIKNISDCKGRLNKKGVVTADTLTNGGIQKSNFINEANLYKVIFQSRKPQAEAFTDWVTSEVLPSIRKHGAYATSETIESIISNPDNGIKLLQALKAEQDKNKALEVENTELKPKALFADAVASSKNSILIGELAKIIKAKGYDIGQNKLFTWMRENGYLMKTGEAYNQPTQKSMELGLMEIKKSTINNPDGSIRTTTTTKITGKGQVYFVNKFCGKKE